MTFRRHGWRINDMEAIIPQSIAQPRIAALPFSDRKRVTRKQKVGILAQRSSIGASSKRILHIVPTKLGSWQK